MPANWTTPRDWTTGELVTSTYLNTHLRDNLLFLKSDPVISETTVATTTTGSVTVATLSAVAVPADVGAVFVECWAISFGITTATANPSTATATLAEATAGTVASSEFRSGEFGTDSWVPFYVRSRDQSWAGTTRTITLAIAGSNGTARLEASAASPIVLRIVRSY